MKVHVKHILVSQKYEAQDLLLRLNGGESFEDLARKYSSCPSAAQGGDLGALDISRLDEDFVEASLSLKEGQMSSFPVRTRFGYHLIYRLK